MEEGVAMVGLQLEGHSFQVGISAFKCQRFVTSHVPRKRERDLLTTMLFLIKVVSDSLAAQRAKASCTIAL